jgi:hypothetical protein
MSEPSKPSPSPVPPISAAARSAATDPSGIRRLFLSVALSTFTAIVVFAVGVSLFILTPMLRQNQDSVVHARELRSLGDRVEAIERHLTERRAATAPPAPAAAAQEKALVDGGAPAN